MIQLAEVDRGRMLDPQVPGLTENGVEGGVAVRTVVVGESEAGTGERQEEDQAVGDEDLISRGAVQETVHERGRRARGDAGRLEAQPGAEERLAAVEGAVLERPIPHALDDPVGRRFDALAVPDADRSPCARNASNPAESGKACRSTGLQGVSGHRPRGRARPDGCWSLPDADALIIVSSTSYRGRRPAGRYCSRVNAALVSSPSVLIRGMCQSRYLSRHCSCRCIMKTALASNSC